MNHSLPCLTWWLWTVHEREYVKYYPSPNALDTHASVAFRKLPFMTVFSLYPLILVWVFTQAERCLVLCRLRQSRLFGKIKLPGVSFVVCLSVLFGREMKGALLMPPAHKGAVLCFDSGDHSVRVKITQWVWFHPFLCIFHFHFCPERAWQLDSVGWQYPHMHF